jgi:transcriptional regulator with XRE-family HTH domain
MFRDRLRELLRIRDIKQKEFAKAVLLSDSTVSAYLKGRRMPDPKTLQRISKYLETTCSYLLEETNDPNPFGKEVYVVLELEEAAGRVPDEAIKQVKNYWSFISKQYQ